MSELLIMDSWDNTAVVEQERQIHPMAIMVGVRAVEATLKLPVEETAPYEYVITEEGYKQARQAGLHEYGNALYDLQQNSLLMTRYGKMRYDDLAPRGYTAEDGQAVAGMPDNYAVMQYNGDTPETAAIRQRLLDPEQPPLELEQMPRERKIVLSLLEKISGAKEDTLYEMTERLLTYAIYAEYTLYGDPDIGQPNQIVGTLEKPENGTFAHYHNGFGAVQDSQDLLQHMENINAPVRMRLLALLAQRYSDIVYGNGRESDNPEAYDEKLSAELLYSHALMLGCPKPEAEWLYDTVELTKFDEKKKSQPGRTAKDPYKRSVTASDLHTLGRRGDGVKSSDQNTFENMQSYRRSETAPLRQVMDRFGVWRLDTLEELRAFTWKYRHEPVDCPDGRTLGEVYYNYTNESAGFHEDYRAPAGWTLDDPEAQLENAAMVRENIQRFAAVA